MAEETGIMRIAKVIEVIGLIWAGLWAVGGFLALLLSTESDKVTLWLIALGMAAVGYGMAYAIAWVIKVFAQKKA